MAWITKEGRTVEEAREAAVGEAGRPSEELEIEVVNEGAKGLFGLGGEPAVVRVRPKGEATDFRHAFHDDRRDQPSVEDDRPYRTAAPDAESAEPPGAKEEAEEDAEGEESDDEQDRVSLSERQEQAAQLGEEIVRGILERMGLEGEVSTRVAGGTVYIEVFGDEMGILIGRSGTTLEALQELVRAGIQRRLKTRQAVVVDVEAYWERRRKEREGRQGGGGGRGGGSGRGRGGRRRGSGGPRPRRPANGD